MSQYHQPELSRLTQNLQLDDGYNNVFENVLDGIDDLLMNHHISPNSAMTPILPPIPSGDDNNTNNNNNSNNNKGTMNESEEDDDVEERVNDITTISKKMGKLQMKQIQVIEKQQKHMASLSSLQSMHHRNMITDLDLNIFATHHQHQHQHHSHHSSPYLRGHGGNGMTPNTSYNSLASLDTNVSGSSPSTTTYPQCDDGMNPYCGQYEDMKTPNDHNHNHNHNLYEYGGNHQVSNVFNGCSTKITQFEPMNDIKLQLKDYVFISKDCTRRLGQYVVKEAWGKEYGLLYKYLDYIFRCQAFKRQIIEVNDKYLIFHSGLQRRCDNQFLYVLLVPNKKYVAQKWRVQFGNIKNSFLSKTELLSKFTESYVVDDYLPQRTRFCASLADLLYDETFPIEVNWEERLTTNKDRICKVLGNLAFFDYSTKFMKLAELITAFDEALQQTQRIAELNPRLAVAQGFVDTKHCKYRMELLLPLVIEFPKYSGNYYTFALAISKSTEINSRKYIAKSILTMDMAYANARLVGYVDSSWLYYGAQNNGKMDINDFFLQNNVSTMSNK